MADEFSETSPLEKETSVKGYASKVFKESSVSAVSAIVSTGNTPRKVFRILVFVLFTVGFLYQCVKFLTYILTYPTVVNIEIDRPAEYLAPAYTFCNYNRIKRSKFCSKYPNSCSNPNKELCNTYPDYCRDNTTKVPKEDSIENLSMEDAMDLGHDSKNLLIRGAWEDPEGPFLRLNAEEQVPVACYSLGVRVDDPRDARYKKKDGWEVTDDEFVFDAEEKEIFYPDSKPGILFALHSPFDAVDPFEEGIFMKPGYLYRIKLQMMREELLPHPYKTDCLNYTEKWLKAGRTGPRSQEMCRHRCGQDFFENCFNCTFIEILYPKKIRICEKIALDDLFEKGCSSGNNYENAVFLESCFKNCKDDCSRTKFSYRVQESYITRKMMSNSTRISSRTIKVKVYFDHSEILTIRYQPQYQEVEAFSYIGGFIGIWLGISLVQVADVFESIFRISRYIFKKGMSACSMKSEERRESAVINNDKLTLKGQA
ncbi:uncharacterized protein TNIN_49311 [Trichonephila inaurata madagascariensis]|uniref:Uncharacterized protein n=1 Tax=Trichonephila inaurata madagascariensis TaxID=2747483 RepID=A0A8X6YPM6_9ARAC|nr:uncharacterized protein TNIN_49311 [Trichonephila inaurata madagascariensis]